MRDPSKISQLILLFHSYFSDEWRSVQYESSQKGDTRRPGKSGVPFMWAESSQVKHIPACCLRAWHYVMQVNMRP